MMTDATVLVVAIVAGMLFSGGILVVVGTLILLHYVVHTRRVSEQNACFQKIRELESEIFEQRQTIRRLESMNASVATRVLEAFKILSAEHPARQSELKDMMDGLVRLFHEYAPQSGIDIDANGDVTIGGSVVGRDKVRQAEYASGLGSAS